MKGTFHCSPGSVILRTGLPSWTTIALCVRSTTKNGEAPRIRSNPTTPSNAKIKFCFVMRSLLLIRRCRHRFLQAIEWEERQQPLACLSIDDHLVDPRQHFFHRFDIETLRDDVLGLAIFFEHLEEPVCFTLRPGDARLRIALGLIDHLRRFSLGPRDNIVAVAL